MEYLVKFFRILFFVSISTFGQVQKVSTLQIGNTSTNNIISSAAFQIDETNRGFLPPRLTLAQRNSIVSPVQGLTIYNVTTNCIEWYTGVSWYNACAYQSSGGTAVVSSYYCNTASSESMIAGTVVSGVTQTIIATVEAPGTYNISTIPVNGIVFSGSGTFTGTGSQNIVLTASGTPTVAGLITFPLNTSPNCNFSRIISSIVTTPVNIPNSITLNQSSKYLVPSCYDNDYLPFVAPTVAASKASLAAGGPNETLINVQGSITTTGVVVKIPVNASASGTLPAYSTTITLPSSVTEDGISRDLTLSWAEQAYTTSTKTITATISAIGGTLNAKKLDINSGIGNDYLGVLIGSFTYPYNSLGIKTTFDIRAISLIPDRMAGIADNSGSTTSHMMFYAPIVAEDGKIWLNNNLGADYSNMNKSNFNPIKQAESATDYNAYASLFQWGRKSDGHELMSWTNSTSGTAVNATTSTPNNIPDNAYFIKSYTSPFDWRVIQDDNLWVSESSTNNPCPLGFKLPTVSDYFLLVEKAVISNSSTAANSILKFTTPGYRYQMSGDISQTGIITYLQTSNIQSGKALVRFIDGGSTFNSTPMKAAGNSVRCIKN